MAVAAPLALSVGGTPRAQQQGFAPQIPPQCVPFLALRDDAEKKGEALQAAFGKKEKPNAQQACTLFTALGTAQSKMLKFVLENGQWCGFPPEAEKQIREG